MMRKLLITAILTFVSVSSAYAKTSVTGDIYGQVFSTMLMGDSGFPYGVTIDDPIEPTENCDNTTQTCYLGGLSWSDVVGWTYWDGTALQTEMELLSPGSFPDEYIAKITYNGNLGGYIWGEKFGWVSLSVCNSLLDAITCGSKPYCSWSGGGYCEANNLNRVPEVSSQDIDDWGIYLDFCPLKLTEADCESATANQFCNWDAGDNTCVFDSVNNVNGQPFGGFAWSEYLGWVKFGPEDLETEFTGAYTNWFPDLTPPHVTIPDPNNPGVDWDPSNPLADPLLMWIPNEGDYASSGAITWKAFVDEKDSFVDLSTSTLIINTIDNGVGGDFMGCPEPTLTSPNEHAIISLGKIGDAGLYFLGLGIIGIPPYGFCKYELSGVLYNASGFGFYFGKAGTAIAISKGLLPGNLGTNIYNANNITFFVRAGDPVPTSISLTPSTTDPVVADGNNGIDISFAPTDERSENLIVSVKASIDGTILPDYGDSDQWVRRVEFLYSFNNPDDTYTFDSIDWLRDALYFGMPAPINIEKDISYTAQEDLQYPHDGMASSDPFLDSYPFKVIGYAPTTTVGNTLTLNTIDFDTNDIYLPAISPTQGPWPASTGPLVLDSVTTLGKLPFEYMFEPALEVYAGSLDSDFLAISQSAQATFSFKNNSTDPLKEYSFDNILSFTGSGVGPQALEVRDIAIIGDSDGATGRTDPNGVATRYGLLYVDLLPDSAAINRFHNIEENYHTPAYAFIDDLDGTNSDGIYEVSGNAFVSRKDDCLKTIPTTCGFIEIDRSDLLTNELSPSGDGTFSFNFVPSRFFGGTSSAQIAFNLDQYTAYFPPSASYPLFQYALYPAPPFIEDKQVKSLGLDTSGTVSGGQIYDSGGNRDIATITTTSSADLRREIRRNVAVLTRNFDPSPCSAPIIFPALPTEGACVIVDEKNKTMIAYYTGSANPTDLITLGTGSNIDIPDGYRYTLILEAVDLNIKDNFVYPPNSATDTSFGIIVIQDSDGIGGNVYLDPKPTNMVGLLYAEGSLLSRSSAGDYYYGAGGDIGELKNQIFWQGGIASRNTIGGATNLVFPKGTDGNPADCSLWNNDPTSCSQAYDLDFVRRFTTIKDSVTGIEYSPAGYLYSGGGQCSDLAPDPNCSDPTLPSTVTILGSGTAASIDPDSKSLDTFFIERDNRPVPPGFSSGGGLTSSQEIR